MDAAQNHYGTFDVVSPMVFVDSEYSTVNKPVYELVVGLAKGKQYGDMLCLADEVSQVVDFIEKHPPVTYQSDH